MAQTTERIVYRRNIKLSNNRYLIFDLEQGLWRVAFYRPRRPGENGHDIRPALQDSMERAGMLPNMPRGHWCRFTTQAPTLATGIYTALEAGDCRSLHNEIIEYVEATSWSWYLQC